MTMWQHSMPVFLRHLLLLPGLGTSIQVSLILLLWRTFAFLGFELNGTKERNHVEAVPFLRTQWTEIHRRSQMDTSREQICRRCLARTNLHLSPIEGVCYQATSARRPSAAVSFHPQSTKKAFHPFIMVIIMILLIISIMVIL